MQYLCSKCEELMIFTIHIYMCTHTQPRQGWPWLHHRGRGLLLCSRRGDHLQQALHTHQNAQAVQSKGTTFCATAYTHSSTTIIRGYWCTTITVILLGKLKVHVLWYLWLQRPLYSYYCNHSLPSNNCPWVLEIHGPNNECGRLHGQAICTCNVYP